MLFSMNCFSQRFVNSAIDGLQHNSSRNNDYINNVGER